MNVAKLLIDPESIRGTTLGTTLCNPVQDNNGDWVVSLLEATYMPIDDFEAVVWEPIIEM